MASNIQFYFVYKDYHSPGPHEIAQKLADDYNSGKITALEYCDHEEADQSFCIQYKNLHGIR